MLRTILCVRALKNAADRTRPPEKLSCHRLNLSFFFFCLVSKQIKLIGDLIIFVLDERV